MNLTVDENINNMKNSLQEIHDKYKICFETDDFDDKYVNKKTGDIHEKSFEYVTHKLKDDVLRILKSNEFLTFDGFYVNLLIGIEELAQNNSLYQKYLLRDSSYLDRLICDEIGAQNDPSIRKSPQHAISYRYHQEFMKTDSEYKEYVDGTLNNLHTNVVNPQSSLEKNIFVEYWWVFALLACVLIIVIIYFWLQDSNKLSDEK